MTAGAGALMERAEAALGAGDWATARDACREMLAAEEVPEAYLGLGSALWWLGEVVEGVRCYEAAYAGFQRRGDAPSAVNVAVAISIITGANFGNRAVANGWSARAARLAQNVDIPELQGWVLLAKAATCEDPDQAEAWSRQALELSAGAHGPDLQLCALSSLGSALIDAGRVDEGAALLDEALAGSLGGEVSSLDTVVFTSCLLMQSCFRCADFLRVIQWTHALQPFIDRYGCPYVHATCRTHHGAVLVATGDWTRAEEELDAADRLAGDALPAVRAEVAAYRAELRVAQGRVEEALALLSGYEDQPVVIPVLAAVRLAAGDTPVAVSIARRRLETAGARTLEAARLREVLGEAAIHTGDAEAAVAEGRLLADLGAELDCDLVVARGERLQGRALASRARPDDARLHLDSAVASFARLEMTWEVARTRMALADALAGTEPAVAAAEAAAALSTFQALGAEQDAAGAVEWLRAHGSDAMTPEPSALGAVTKRERDVLACLGDGLSNPEIADRLYISRRTVEHHVASLFSKLGLRNRSEAAAFAVRHLGQIGEASGQK